MNKYPLVSINILSFNRSIAIKESLTKIFEQNYTNIEVIVVDNASSDGTPSMIADLFPSINLLSLDKNIGIDGYNKGMKIIKGECILILDDDSYPDTDTIAYGVNYLLENPEIGALTFNIFNNALQKSETLTFKQTNPYLFHGCGTLFRKTTLDKVGGYDPDYFLYYNEIDLAIRCYNNNIQIKYIPNKIVFHNSLIKTSNTYKDYHLHKIKYEQYFTGHLRFLIKHFNWNYVLLFGVKWILNRFIVSIVYNYHKSFFKVLFQLPRVLGSSYQKRFPVNISIQKYYSYGNQPLIDHYFFPNYKFKK